ncbi:MAG TPA: hypothetical protein VEK38_01820 [Candidatus Bathyarchaeia archaeon]|nr:hypothetical protein [Candidatus Bathyarchaeia archaeon]
MKKIGIFFLTLASLFIYNNNYAIKNPSCTLLLEDLDVHSIAQAREKVKDFDELLDALEASTVQEALEHFNNLEDFSGRMFHFLAQAIGLEEELTAGTINPKEIPKKVVEAIRRLQATVGSMQKASGTIAAHINRLEKIITQAIQAKEENNMTFLLNAIPDTLPTLSFKPAPTSGRPAPVPTAIPTTTKPASTNPFLNIPPINTPLPPPLQAPAAKPVQASTQPKELSIQEQLEKARALRAKAEEIRQRYLKSRERTQ